MLDRGRGLPSLDDAWTPLAEPSLRGEFSEAIKAVRLNEEDASGPAMDDIHEPRGVERSSK